jgi:DNA-binding HxlR family transcriptional regulator
MRLLADEANAAILKTLGDGPLRSSQLKDRLAHFSPRTIYRRIDELVRLGVLEQRRWATTPPAVVYQLAAPAGTDLLAVLERSAVAWLRRLGEVPVEGRRWGLIGLLADGWDSAIVRELSREPRSLTELGVVSDLTYHQLARRMTRLTAAGLLERTNEGSVSRYTLSHAARDGCTVVAASARWERRHLAGNAHPLFVADAVALLRSALPLTRLPQHAGGVFDLTVEPDANALDAERFASLRVEVGAAGAVSCFERGDLPPRAWVRGSIDAWLAVLLDGDLSTVQVGGDSSLPGAHLAQLHARTAGLTAPAQ